MALAWGILGTGEIAHRFAAELPLSRTGHLAAVGSRTLEKARHFGAEHGSGRCHGSYEELLEDDGVQAIYIATPHPMHAEWAIKAAEHGKHVLCEKPLTTNHAEAMAVVDAAYRHDVVLLEAYAYRCHPRTRQLMELVRSGVIGDVHHIQSSYSFRGPDDVNGRLLRHDLGGGGILDVGGYPVSMCRLLAGAATGEAFAEPDEISGAGQVGADSRVDEWAIATLRFPGEIVGQVATGVRLAADDTLHVFGSEGYLVVPNPWCLTTDTSIFVHRVGYDEPEKIAIEYTPLFANEADTVAAHIGERQAPAMRWDDTLGNMATLDRWRAEVGATLDAEWGDAFVPPVHGRQPTPRPGHAMRYGEIPGLAKPVSRLVMGVDNQPLLPHASVMFDDFMERGGNCFDTAHNYGDGKYEALFGQWMKNRGVRDDIVIIGKGAHTPDCDPVALTRQLHESLQRLGTDHVDLYMMHRDDPGIPVGEFVDVLNEHQQAGRIGVFGVSNWSPERFTEANHYAEKNGFNGFGLLSNHFSLAHPLDLPWDGCHHVTDRDSRAWLERAQVPLFPWSSQARGFLTGRAHPDDRSDLMLVRCWYSDENFERLSRARQLAERLGVPLVAVSLAYVLAQPFPTFPIIGPRAVAETRTSLQALGVELTPETVRWLDLEEPT